MKWKSHKEKWINCKNCDLCEIRNKVVLYKGKLPADILFVMDNPGVSEDELGKAFVGKASKLLDQIITDSGAIDHKLGFTYLVACKPQEERPTAAQITACSDRLLEIVEMANPSVIVTLGKTCDKGVKKIVRDRRIRNLSHPGKLVIADISQRGLLIQKTILQLEDIVDELVPF